MINSANGLNYIPSQSMWKPFFQLPMNVTYLEIGSWQIYLGACSVMTDSL